MNLERDFLKEIQRQKNSLLYERLVLSKDKEKVLELAEKGQVLRTGKDLVFYNRLLRCFVIIDLKIGKITHQDIGQMQMYVNYYDRDIKSNDENKIVGILLSTEKNETVVKYTLPENNDSIFSSEYKLHLPTEQELIEAVEEEKKILELEEKSVSKESLLTANGDKK